MYLRRSDGDAQARLALVHTFSGIAALGADRVVIARVVLPQSNSLGVELVGDAHQPPTPNASRPTGPFGLAVAASSHRPWLSHVVGCAMYFSSLPAVAAP